MISATTIGLTWETTLVAAAAEVTGADCDGPRVRRRWRLQLLAQGLGLGWGEHDASADDQQVAGRITETGDDHVGSLNGSDHGTDDALTGFAVLDLHPSSFAGGVRGGGAFDHEAFDPGRSVVVKPTEGFCSVHGVRRKLQGRLPVGAHLFECGAAVRPGHCPDVDPGSAEQVECHEGCGVGPYQVGEGCLSGTQSLLKEVKG